MNKIFLIIRREYLTRVRKKSFIIMTILGPVIMAALFVIPIYIATQTNETKMIAVLDESGIFREKFKDSDDMIFHYTDKKLDAAKADLAKGEDHALLYIPKPSVTLPSNAIFYTRKTVSINVTSYVKNVMSKRLEELKLQARLHELQPANSDPINVDDILRSIRTQVDVSTLKIEEDGSESKSFTELNMVLGFFVGFLIYMFIFMYGSQVMRGVLDEKTSRIVEVIISSVKPFQLMMGKIIGVALVGLTQFFLWIVLTFGIVTITTTLITTGAKTDSMTSQMLKQQTAPNAFGSADTTAVAKPDQGIGEVLEAIDQINFPVMISMFLFYFLFGYLLYAAMFAAIGGAVDNESDTQQFMLPVTVPLVLSLLLLQFIIQEPHGPAAFWLSIFPLTSPVVMMVRLPFEVPVTDVVLSMTLLVLTFVGMTWVAGKVYRTGILMYGKKVNYRELWKWIRYR